MPPAYEFRGRGGGRNNDRRPRPRHEFTFRYPQPRSTSDRPLLTSKTETAAEFLVGPRQQNEEKPSMKYAPVEGLSDSDEQDMDVSTDEEDDASHPRKRRAVESSNNNDNANAAPVAAPAPAPKWSNPDPYTVLPPPDESRGKKLDVIKLIRKARVEAHQDKPPQQDAVASNEDFISFGAVEEAAGTKPPDSAPKGPRSQEKDLSLGSRKRTYDDELKGYSKKTGKPLGNFNVDGSIIDQWRASSFESATPWFNSAAPTLHMGTRLQNEILDFFHWVKPQPYEHIVRTDLVARLQSAFQSRYYGVQVRTYGSSASGLYLPTADVDLVLLSSNFMRTGVKTFGERKGQLYAFANFLKNSVDMVAPNSIEVIAHARVPILKFVDKYTGIRVDMSFDNDSGLVANETFHNWKAEYPAMPVIVAVVKQFLLLRGLNEVPTGGLGGFSITCIVTSLLQHMPHGHVEQNLGSILLEFFDFYGNFFDYENVGIRLNPPGYFNKRVYKSIKDRNNERLSIEDPNNPDNDISGGTREILIILRAFSDAYRALKRSMTRTAMTGWTKSSLLGCIIGANYDEYTQQRQQLREVFETSPRFARYHEPPPPPPPLPEHMSIPPPPPPSSSYSPAPAPGQPQRQDSKEKLTKVQRRLQASRDRATRLRSLRPDIASVPDSITLDQCMSLGGYSSVSMMDKDLVARERSMKV